MSYSSSIPATSDLCGDALFAEFQRQYTHLFATMLPHLEAKGVALRKLKGPRSSQALAVLDAFFGNYSKKGVTTGGFRTTNDAFTIHQFLDHHVRLAQEDYVSTEEEMRGWVDDCREFHRELERMQSVCPLLFTEMAATGSLE